MYGFKCEFLKMRRNLCELGKLSSNIKIRGAAKGGKNGGNITKRRNYAAKKHGIETWYDPTWYDQNSCSDVETTVRAQRQFTQ